MYKCLNVLLAVPLLLLPVSAQAHPAQEQCWLPGMVRISTEGLQPTGKLTICTALPPHIRPYLSIRNYVFATEGCVDVRINDRGPYIGARELDLSYGAAKVIGLVEPGVATVSISYL